MTGIHPGAGLQFQFGSGVVEGPDPRQRRIDVFDHGLHARPKRFLQIPNSCESDANVRGQSDQARSAGQGVLRMFPDRDVFCQGHDVGRFALGVAGERNTLSHPDDGTVFPQAALFDNVVVDFSGQHLPAERGITLAIFGMREGIRIDLGEFLSAEAENITEGVIHLEKTALRVGEGHADSGLRQSFAEAFLVGAEIQASLLGCGHQAAVCPLCTCQC